MTAIGMLINERYRLDSEIDRGGMGAVYRAHDVLLDRDVAVKLLLAAALDSETSARLLREAQAAAQLNHPNIASVYDAGEADGLSFIVMELVEGSSLHKQRPESLDEILAIARQVCAALEHAHAHGIVHRDLKPENVLLTRDALTGAGGVVKLVDFGLARSLVSRLTTDGTITGTVFYLAPELALGQDFDGRADLYALGVMLYELTTGQLPFTADEPLAVISQHLHAPVVPPHAKADKVPPALNSLILHLLSKRPEDRPASASEVLQILNSPDFLLGEAVLTRELSVLDRIKRGRIVRRERELQEARNLWNQVLAGQGRMLLISGEPGIGKTRLVQELATQVRVAGNRALVGACYAEGGGPYAPFAQILRRVFEDGTGGDRDGLRDFANVLPPFVLADLVTLAPALRLRFPDVPPNPALDPKSQQQRLFESVVAFCAALSEVVPVMFVVEDVHWGDSGTLSLLRHLARRARRQRMLLVATYREVELDVTRPFRQVLQDLHRERLAERMKLSRLGREGTKELLSVLFDADISPEFVEGIYRETEGNPFFIEEVCKALVESGEVYFADGRWDRPSMEDLEIPQSVRMAIQSRVGKLTPQVQEILRQAAVLGREFDFDTLAEASAVAATGNQDENALVDALESAEYAQLIGEVSAQRGGTFAFTHALFPTTLIEGLSGLRRRRMHRQAAVAIERLRPQDYESLAFHALEGGELTKGLDFSLRAAEKAQRVFASEEALRHFERAREIAESLDLPDQLSTIHEAIGDVELWRDIPKSIEAFERVLRLPATPEKRATIKSKIGSAYVLVGDERGLAYLEAAEKELDPATQGNELARTISDIGRLYHHRGQHQQALTYLERARQIAEPLDDALTVTFIYSHLAGSHQHLANLGESTEWARQTIALGERKDYPLAVATGYEYLAEDASTIGDWQDALGFAEQDRRIGEKTGYVQRAAWAEYCDAATYYGLGSLLTAREAGQKALAIAEAMGEARLVALAAAQLSLAQMDLGQIEKAEQNARYAVERGSELNLTYMISRGLDALAHWYMQQGNWENAFDQLDQSARLAAGTDNRLIPLLDGPRFAEACLRVGQIEKAAEVVERTLALAREAPSPHIEAVTYRVQAQILAEQGSWDEAARCFEAAVTRLEGLGSRLELGRTLYHQGETQAKRGQVDAARASLARALEIFQDRNANIDAGKVQTALASLETGV